MATTLAAMSTIWIETPIACGLDAITAADRPRYNELRRMLADGGVGKRELPDGIALQISTDRMHAGAARGVDLVRAQMLPVPRFQNRRRARSPARCGSA